MKLLLFVIGTLAGLYTIAAGFQFLSVVMNVKPGTTYGASNIAAALVPIFVGLIVCIACFRKALGGSKPK